VLFKVVPLDPTSVVNNKVALFTLDIPFRFVHFFQTKYTFVNVLNILIGLLILLKDTTVRKNIIQQKLCCIHIGDEKAVVPFHVEYFRLDKPNMFALP